MVRMLAALFLALSMTGSRVQDKMHPLSSLPPLQPEQAKSPLELAVYLPSANSDLDPVRSWIPADSLAVKLYVMVRVTNISDQSLVLPGFCHWAPGFAFTSDSPDAMTPPFFRTLNGQINWILLKPRESAYGYDNIAGKIAFTRSGRYSIQYQIDVGYCDYRGNGTPKNEETLTKEFPSSDHRSINHGIFEIRVSPEQVTAKQ